MPISASSLADILTTPCLTVSVKPTEGCGGRLAGEQSDGAVGFPTFMAPAQFQEFMNEYATQFDLHKDIVFNATVKSVTRNANDAKWSIAIERDGSQELLEFDKVAFCHGYQTKAKIPTFEGQDKFEGTITHSQQYRTYDISPSASCLGRQVRL